MQQQSSKPNTAAPRKNLPLLGAVGVVLIGLAGLYLYLFEPPKPFVVRWQLQRYLKAQAGTRDFTVKDFAFPSKADMAKATKDADKKPGLEKGPKTGKTFDILREEYLKEKTAIFHLLNSSSEATSEIAERKQMVEELTREIASASSGSLSNLEQLKWRLDNQSARIRALEKVLQSKEQSEKEAASRELALEPVVSDLWEFQKLFAAEVAAAESSAENALAKARAQFNTELRQKLNEAQTYAAIYRAIGQELFVADRLLESRNVEHRRQALQQVMLAIDHASREAENYWLAARLCEAYLWPNLDASVAGRQSPVSYDGLINTCANVFRQNGEYEQVVRTYKLMISQSKDTNRIDGAYMQMAFAYEQAGDYKGALSAAHSIKGTNNFRWLGNRIQQWEKQVEWRASNK